MTVTWKDWTSHGSEEECMGVRATDIDGQKRMGP